MDRRLLQRLQGERVDVPSHETRVLSGDPALWLVESGSMAVSCAEVEAGQPVGPRHYLFRGGTAQHMWALPHGRARGLQLLAVPIEDVALRVVPLERVWEVLTEEPEAAEPLLTAWAESLSGQMLDVPPQQSAVAIERPGPLTLEPGESARTSRSGLWVVVEEGEVFVRGVAAWSLGAGTAPLPWTEALWLVAPAGARVRILRARDLPDARSVGAGLAELERIVLAEIDATTQRELATEDERLRSRAARQAELASNAARDLVGSFEPGGAAPQRATPLLTAIGAICDGMGVDVKLPGGSEHARSPLEAADAIARATGVRTRRILLEGAWSKADCGPLLAFQGEERAPVALLVGRGQRYDLFDPADGTRKRLTRALEATLQPQATVWYRPLPARKLTLFDLFKFSLHGRAGDLVVMGATAVAATLLGMVTPQATAIVMDSAIPDADRRLLFEIGLMLLIAAFGKLVFSVSQSYISVRMSTRAQQDGQSAVWDRLLSLRPTFFRKYSSGDMLDRAMSVHRIGEQLTGATVSGLFSGMMALLNLGLLYYYSSQLALVALAVAGLTAGGTALSAFAIRKKAVALQELSGKFSGFQIQVVQGVAKLRVAGAEGRAYAQWMHRYSQQIRLTLRIAGIQDWSFVFNLVISSISTVALFWFGYALLTGAVGGMSIGIFLAFVVAYGSFLGGTRGVSNTLIGLFDVLAASKRLVPILEEAPEADPARSAPGLLRGRVAAEHVTFRYREDGPAILENVTVHAEPGEFVAIVGSSGSGKSTLLRLLLGFETPESGAIYYDGSDLAGVDVRAVRMQLGIVLQGGRLTQGSLMDNIATGSQVPLDEVAEAVRKAGFEDDLADLPMGLHTIVSEGGTNLSGGQRQRVLIARALVYKPKLLLFDEATSALDNHTQAVVGESLEQMNVTRLVIAHRLSTIRNADRIYVLDAGRVAESGTYEDLKRANGLFARMMARQMA